MPNTFLTTTKILEEALIVLKNNLQFARYINRQYVGEFAKAGAKVGATVNARKPPKYMGGYGNGLHLEDIVEEQVGITVDQLFGVHFTFTDVELTLSMDRFRSRYLDSATARIANEIDRAGLQNYREIYNSVGTPGTVPSDMITYLNSGVRLDNTGTPRRGRNSRNCVIGAQMQADLVNALRALFESGARLRDQYEDGEMGQALGYNFSMDQNIDTHTVGALGGTPLVNLASQTGNTLNIDGATGSVTNWARRGDVFTITSGTAVNGVKPQTASTAGAVSTGVAQQFVVTAAADSTAGGAVALSIEPAITPSGQRQTVTASPDDNATVTWVGAASTATPQGLAFHKDFITLVTVDLEPVRGVDMAGRINDDDLGIAMRLVRAYDVNTNSRPTRLEVLFGWQVLWREMACRIQS